MRKNLVACLKGVWNLTGNFEGASLANAPLKAWEESIPIRTGIRTAVRESLAFIRPLEDAMYTMAGKAAVQELNRAFDRFRSAIGGRNINREAYKLIDPEGKMLGPGEKVADFYRADSAQRIDAFFSGKLNADALRGLERWWIQVKAFYIDALERAKQFSEFPDLYPRKPFTMDSDIKSPLIKLAQKTMDVNTLPYDMATIYTKKMYVRMMKAPESGLVPFHEWFNFTYPQVAKQAYYNPALKKIGGYLAEMSPAERRRIGRVSERIAGKKTWTQKQIDDQINWVLEANGKESLEFSPSSKFTLGITQSLYRGIQWANPGMAIVNTSQGINTAAKTGVLNTLDGAINFASKEGRDLVRRYETTLFGEFHKIFTTDSMLGKLDQSMLGFGLFNKAEYFNRGVALHAGISEFIKRNKIGGFQEFLALEKTNPDLFARGIRYGMDVVQDTQFVYSTIHQSPLLTGPFSRLFVGQYMSYPINQAEFIWRGVKNDPVWFPLRWITLTGVGASAAYYGAGMVFKGMGGAGMLPVAKDMWDAGYQHEAMQAAVLGAVDFLPTEIFRLERGLTPMNGMLLDTLRTIGAFAKGDQNEITKATATMARSWGNLLPGFVMAKRASEGILTQLANEGKRYESGSEGAGAVKSALEATGFVPLFNATLNKYLGGAIPGLPTKQTGRLSHEEGMRESLYSSIGLRSREAESRFREQGVKFERMFEFRGDRAAFADQAALALEEKNHEKFSQLVQAAIQQRLVADPRDLKTLLAHAINARTLTKEQKLEKRMPRALKMKQLLDSMEDQ